MKCNTSYANRLPGSISWVADVDRLFHDWMGEVASRPARGFVPALDIRESATEYRLVFELPGVLPEDVQIEVRNDVLLIQGEKKPWPAQDHQDKTHRLERSHGPFQRSLKFPQPVDFDRADATFQDGLLHLVIPKSAKAMARTIEIKRCVSAPSVPTDELHTAAPAAETNED